MDQLPTPATEARLAGRLRWHLERQAVGGDLASEEVLDRLAVGDPAVVEAMADLCRSIAALSLAMLGEPQRVH